MTTRFRMPTVKNVPNIKSKTWRSANYLVVGLFISLSIYFYVIFRFAYPFQHHKEEVHQDVRILSNLVDIQNKTISALMSKVKCIPSLLYLFGSKKADTDVSALVIQSRRNQLRTPLERECDAKYGLQLVANWRETEEVWCQESDKQNSPHPASLKCYPYQQIHREAQGKGKDMFCVAENFVLDFTMFGGEPALEGIKLFPNMAYLDVYGSRTLSASCKRTDRYNGEMFMPHTKPFFVGAFDDQIAPAQFNAYEDTATYLLPRDEDSENTFHSGADYMNMFVVKEVLDYDVADQQVLLMDKMPNGAGVELIEKAFAPVHGVHRISKYQNQKVMFKRLIFHLESPAALIFPETSTTGPQKCRDSSLFDAYRRHVLQAFDLLDVSPPPIPSATLIVRRRTPLKNVGRVLENEEEVVSTMQQQAPHLLRTQVVDLAALMLADQLRIVRQSNILVGVHGAGLSWILFAADEAVLLEIHPSYREDRHFRHIARMANKDYMPMRSTVRETCLGTSDNVHVDMPEFLRALDGAVRLARNYDGGIAECGLNCPHEILAMDAHLDPYYILPVPTPDQSAEDILRLGRGTALDTSFPCSAVL